MPNISAEKRDETSPVWDMSQERVFVETTLHQRLNFFLAFFVAIFAGVASAKTIEAMRLSMLLGSVICGLLGLVLARAQNKVSRIQAVLSKDPTHPYTIINQGAFGTGFSWVKIIGYVIPGFCCTVLFLALISTFVKCGLSPETFR